MANGEEKSLGTENMLDRLKIVSHLLAVIVSGSGSSAMSGSDDFGRKVAKLFPGVKTLYSFVKHTGKKVDEQTKILICKQTATLVAAAQLLPNLGKPFQIAHQAKSN